MIRYFCKQCNMETKFSECPVCGERTEGGADAFLDLIKQFQDCVYTPSDSNPLMTV